MLDESIRHQRVYLIKNIGCAHIIELDRVIYACAIISDTSSR
jgi:hypothetical protein